jgi:hypothetical protein
MAKITVVKVIQHSWGEHFDVQYVGPYIAVSVDDCWPVHAVDALDAYTRFKRVIEDEGHTLAEPSDGEG